jgi:hypothetical protein
MTGCVCGWRAWAFQWVVGVGVVVCVSAVANAQGTNASTEAEQVRARQRISTMEGVLERAVSNGAENLLRQVRTVMPDPPMLSGVPRVRGFRLESYGVFFDVEVPALRLPVTWPLRFVIDDNRDSFSPLLAELRRIGQQLPSVRDQLEQLAQRMEVRAAAPQVRRRTADPVVTNPDDAYTTAVREALVDAMIENSGPIALAAEEWLTVAARDNLPRDPLAPGETAGLKTLMFRVKGADLAAFRAGRQTLEDTRRRVEVKEN